MSKKTSIICTGLAALLCVAGMTQMYRMMTTENSVSAEEVESVDMVEETQDLTSHCIPDDYDLNYRIHGDTAEVYKMVYTMESPEEVVVADTYEGLPVTSIAEETFAGFAFVKCFSLPDGIEKIGRLAFYKCNSLQEIDLPKNLKTIDAAAFLECKSLKTVYLYDDLESIGNSCFDFSLKDVYYSGTEEQWNAIKIGAGNTSLKKATIHFNSTASTEADSVNVTEETQDLTSHCIPTVCDVDYRINGDTAEAYGMVVIVDSPKDREELPKEIVVADTWRDVPVTAIAEEAFLDVDFAESIVLPDSVETIGVCAFLGCTSLQEIHLPKNLKTIDAAAFLECKSLKTVYLYDDLESIGNSCFDFSLKDVYYSGTEEQWNAIKIGAGNTSLKKATIHFNEEKSPNSMVKITASSDENIIGDVDENGTVDIIDVLALNQYLLGIADVSDSGKVSADVDSNGIIDDADAMNILKYLVHLIDSFDSLKAK